MALGVELSRVRAQGYAVDNEEHEPGIRCVAAPIRNHIGEVIAAISISGPAIRLTMKRIENELKALVIATGLAISRSMGAG